jgi:hypothetical protein
MKKILYLVAIVLMALSLTGCGSKFKGYWCNYKENAIIIVLFKKGHTEAHVKAVEDKFTTYINLANSTYYPAEEYAKIIGDSSNIYDAYYISFDSLEHVPSYVQELESMDGVLSASQQSAKNNISLYNLAGWGNYTYSNSDESDKSDLETGTYKIKKGVITFKPKNSKGNTKLLYIKDNHLCGDVDCTQVYFSSTETCSGKAK